MEACRLKLPRMAFPQFLRWYSGILDDIQARHLPFVITTVEEVCFQSGLLESQVRDFLFDMHVSSSPRSYSLVRCECVSQC